MTTSNGGVVFRKVVYALPPDPWSQATRLRHIVRSRRAAALSASAGRRGVPKPKSEGVDEAVSFRGRNIASESIDRR